MIPKLTNPMTALNEQIMAGITEGARKRGNPAEWIYERLVKQIVEFENELSADEEIGGRFVSAPSEGAFHIDDITYWGPDMVIFHGKNHHGRPVQLIQHYSQLNVLLTALPKESATPRRIGFDLAKRVAETKDNTGDE